MRKTIRQSVQRMTRGQPELEVATIVGVDVLSTDANNVVTSVAPSITVNIHGKGGLQRVELSAGIDPLELNIGDQLFVTRVQDRYIGVALLPISNRTQGGGESEGTGESVDFMAQPQNVTGLIAGNQLELAWQPVQGADYYEIWASESADPQSDGARVIARTPNTTWTGKGDGQFFDDGMYYGIVPHAESGTGGRAGSFSDWLQPTFVGNYALGILSKNQTTGIGGSLVVTKSASITRADFTSLDNPQTWTIDVCDPVSAHSTTPLFAVNEILRAVDTSGNALWMKVTATRDMDTYWRYTVNKQSPSAGTNYTILSGSQVLSYGTSGQGTFAVSADGTFGAGTLWTIFTHAGAPWSTTTAQVYANSSGQLVAGGGAVALDANGATFVEPAADALSVPSSLTWRQALGGTVYSQITDWYQTSITTRNLTLAANFDYVAGTGGVAAGGKVILISKASDGTTAGLNVFAHTTGISSITATVNYIYYGDLEIAYAANKTTFQTNGGTPANTLVLDHANGYVGIGVATPVSPLHVGSGTLAGAAPTGETFNACGDASSNADHLMHAFTANFTGTTATSLQALEGYATASNASGTVGTVYGVIGHTQLVGAGAATNLVAFESSNVLSNGSGAVTNAYNFRASPLVRVGTPGTVTNAYAFYADAMTATGVTNKWAFYSAGANDKSYFAGTVGIGTASPTSGYKLETSESILVNSSTNNSGFVSIFTGASSASVGPQNSFTTNDGAAVVASDRIGAFLFNGFDGTANVLSAAIIARATETWATTTNRGSSISFLTTPNGSVTISTPLIVTSTALTLADAVNIAVNATTGTKIGTATTQKLGFWNVTPIVQPTTSYGAASFTANAGTAVNDASTFDGYTIKQVVSALRGTGLLA